MRVFLCQRCVCFPTIESYISAFPFLPTFSFSSLVGGQKSQIFIRYIQPFCQSYYLWALFGHFFLGTFSSRQNKSAEKKVFSANGPKLPFALRPDLTVDLESGWTWNNSTSVRFLILPTLLTYGRPILTRRGIILRMFVFWYYELRNSWKNSL